MLEYHQAAAGADGTAGAVTVSNAFILGGPDSAPLAKGSSAGMFLSVYNGGDSAEKLISVDATSVAKSVQLAGGSITVPSQSSADLSGPEPKIVLRNLTQPLTGGQTVTVLLTFSNAGSIELSVPVEARTTYYSTFLPPAPAPVPSATKRAGAAQPGRHRHAEHVGIGVRVRLAQRDPHPQRHPVTRAEGPGHAGARAAGARSRGPPDRRGRRGRAAPTRRRSRTCSRARGRSRCAAGWPGRPRSWPAAA